MKVIQRKKVKLVRVSPVWLWAYKHDNRITKHWNWRLIEAMRKPLHTSCVPFALYKWKAFGFDGKHQPVWTINSFLGEVK